MAKLYFYYSAMNAGKSTTLLQASYNYVERGMQTLLFAPIFDDRFSKEVGIYSRIGINHSAIAFHEDFNFYSFAKEKIESMQNLKCILIDEAHFLKKHQVQDLCLVASNLGLAVLCYGLRSDFMAEPFEGSKYLLCRADELIEIKTMCTCGKKATMNMRIDAKGKPIVEGAQIQIGGNESYISKCLSCFYQETKLCHVEESFSLS